MPYVEAADGAQIFYKDWGSGRPVVLSHGWPLNSDSWEAQQLFLAENGFRAIAHGRRGHGRSTQTWGGNDMSQGIRDAFWRQGLQAGHRNAYECIAAFSATDFRADLDAITVPTLVIHGDDDQVVPFEVGGKASAERIKNATLTVYPGAPHGITDTHKQQLSEDLHTFLGEKR